MKRTRKVFCYNIIWNSKDSIMFVTGPDMLQNFAEKGYLGFFSGADAPRHIEVEVTLDEDYLEDLGNTYQLIKEALEGEVGLKSKRFDFRIMN